MSIVTAATKQPRARHQEQVRSSGKTVAAPTTRCTMETSPCCQEGPTVRHARPDRILPILLGLSGCLGGAEAPPVMNQNLTDQPTLSLVAPGCSDWVVESVSGTSMSLYRAARSLSIDIFPDFAGEGITIRPEGPSGDMGFLASLELTNDLPEAARVEWGLFAPGSNVPLAAIRLEKEGVASVRLLRQPRPGESATVDGHVVEARRIDATRSTVVMQRRGSSVLLKALWGRTTLVQRADSATTPLQLAVSLRWPRGTARANGRSIGVLFDRFKLQVAAGRTTQDVLACP